ncbi:hypothetical protein AVEN_121125-1 [Araneus ventricosus]|uniref:Uncharacterized protein n=1 Tax=Araneus ventricosus TaxID=182803 RepID=A0A4Y2QWE9_ARAVE|nr:hypothetical protein AVEN_270446-1 [Araneus ventricosus]GBN67798.1 hypothetical protein AVEN_121125-1 [Araneus ventricosus]
MDVISAAGEGAPEGWSTLAEKVMDEFRGGRSRPSISPLRQIRKALQKSSGQKFSRASNSRWPQVNKRAGRTSIKSPDVPADGEEL